jgi:hypothetical protein
MADFVDAARTPCAETVQIYTCGRDGCGKPHIVLFDDNGNAYAQFVCSRRFAIALLDWFVEEGEHKC